MNRCNSSNTTRRTARHAVLVAALCTLCALASAQDATQERVRNFPPHARRGVMLITDAPAIQLNGRDARLAPGARIHDLNNLLVVSGAFAGQNLVVNYVRGPMGLIQEVWVLNATEAQQPMAGDAARNNYISAYPAATTDGAALTASPSTLYTK